MVGGWYDNAERNRGWTITAPGDDATSGIWTRVDPIGVWEEGIPVQPEDDATPAYTVPLVGINFYEESVAVDVPGLSLPVPVLSTEPANTGDAPLELRGKDAVAIDGPQAAEFSVIPDQYDRAVQAEYPGAQ